MNCSFANYETKYLVVWPGTPSEFDEVLNQEWTKKDQEGVLRYHLNISETRVLPGRFRYLAQLNTDRATNRRLPEEYNSVNHPFDPNKFNFTKIDSREILLKIKNDNGEHVLAVNISPLERLHCLLLPSVRDCLPQIVTVQSLDLAATILMISYKPNLRIGFNSLGGFATVNHLHFHLYELNHVMPLETIEVEHLQGPCWQLTDFPAKAFAFQITSEGDKAEILNAVHKLTTCFHKNNTAHNIVLTRGTQFDGVPQGLVRNCIRIYVWARARSGVKILDAFNPGLCELFGHLVVKKKESFDRLTEPEVAEILEKETHEFFLQMKPLVVELFS